jgi:hypothetical protein
MGNADSKFSDQGEGESWPTKLTVCLPNPSYILVGKADVGNGGQHGLINLFPSEP